MSSEAILIYGASDDLVEVEGAITDEFDCYGVWEGTLESPEGERLIVQAEYRGDWAISVHAGGTDGYPEWPINFTERPDREGDAAVRILAPAGTTLTVNEKDN